MKRLTFLLFLMMLRLAPAQSPRFGEGWPTYGGDPGGDRYSDASQITPANVTKLRIAWEFHTHALERNQDHASRSQFEATPILFAGALYLSTPFDEVIALDPISGKERWSFDPKLAPNLLVNYTSRGVAAWQDHRPDATGRFCGSRIFLATLDARLIALDATTGQRCSDFGTAGSVDLRVGIPTSPTHPYRSYANTSPATVIGDVVVLGSVVGDVQDIEMEPGSVRGFDVRTGKLLWTWDPLPWAATQHPRTSAANAWSVLSADPDHNLVFVPTTSPTVDFYGGFRKGDDRDANSVVALNAQTGQKVWAFQAVHHDLWDYDIAAEPLLFNWKGTVPAVAFAAKPGILFVLNRLTGEPLVPVTEKPVPQTDVPGEESSPTQPFTSLTVNPLSFDPKLSSGICRDRMIGLRYDGVYTPPTVRGTLQFPGSLGGVNWGSMSLDPATDVLYVNTNGSAYQIQLLTRPSHLQRLRGSRRFWVALVILIFAVGFTCLLLRKPALGTAWLLAALLTAALGRHLYHKDVYHRVAGTGHRFVNSPDSLGEVSEMGGSPYQLLRQVLQNEDGDPCTPQPWGATTAINLTTGQVLFRKPLGTRIPGQHTGTINFGAPIVTKSGLLFTAASTQALLRAINKTTGEELWTGALPVPAQSTPITYMANGRQYVVVAAGGHAGIGTPLGDSVVAFALP